MIRLFTAIELPEEIQEQVYSLRGGVPLARWVDKEKLHLTLHFIGNIQEDIADEIHYEMTHLRFPSFNLALTEVGYFETAGVPHHIWVGVSYYQALDDLSAKIARICEQHGVQNDRFKFHAHVTLASLHGTTMDDVHKFIAMNNLFRTPEFQVYYFTLFSSHARAAGEGKYYRIEARYPLTLY